MAELAWNFADLWTLIATTRPEAPVAVHGPRCVRWADWERRARSLGAGLLGEGLGRGAKVAQYLPNRPEYLESLFGCLKASLVPVNTNYRYGVDELAYLWDNADAEAVIFDRRFTSTVERVKDLVSGVRVWLYVGPPAECPSWAIDYELFADRDEVVRTPGGPHDHDVLLLYTGGTTGKPKGVVWRQGDLLSLLTELSGSGLQPGTSDGLAAQFAAMGSGPGSLAASPLMHGTGLFHAMSVLTSGGFIVTLPDERFDPVSVLDAIEQNGVKSLVIVGDGFGRPMLAAVQHQPERWTLPSLRVIFSSGAMWSEDVKRQFLERFPRVALVDGLGSSEAAGIGSSVSTRNELVTTATFRPSARTAVILDNGAFAHPGDGQIGHVAVTGWLPDGYYKDPRATARMLREIDGRRWCLSGDLANVEPDGQIRLIGRGSNCINTAGEKVFPEEVEEALKTHGSVADSAVVGVPDPLYGEVVVALVELDPGAAPTSHALIDHVKDRLAGYKAPKLVAVVETLSRGPHGKLDYPAVREMAVEAWHRHQP